ncbi:MAG TPA: DUF2334 domain-containing protein [Aldersonia sp.]
MSTLIVSVSGIRDDTLEHAASFADDLDHRGVPLSLLVAPRLKDKYRLVRDRDTQEWLRGRRGAGDAIVLHGYDQAATKRRRAEFADLSQHEARLRLTAADRVLEEVGLATDVFAGPRWQVSDGARSALPGAGFRILATASTVEHIVRGNTVRAKVLGIGEGQRAEPWRCRALVLGAARVARRGGLVRLAISAKQLGNPGPRQAVLDAVDLALQQRARAIGYGIGVLADAA